MKAPIQIFLCLICVLLGACQNQHSSHQEMMQLLIEAKLQQTNNNNNFAPKARLTYYDSLLKVSDSRIDEVNFTQGKAHALLQLGEE